MLLLPVRSHSVLARMPLSKGSVHPTEGAERGLIREEGIAKVLFPTSEGWRRGSHEVLSKPAPFGNLPRVLIESIFNFLPDPSDIAAVELTCRTFYLTSTRGLSAMRRWQCFASQMAVSPTVDKVRQQVEMRLHAIREFVQLGPSLSGMRRELAAKTDKDFEGEGLTITFPYHRLNNAVIAIRKHPREVIVQYTLLQHTFSQDLAAWRLPLLKKAAHLREGALSRLMQERGIDPQVLASVPSPPAEAPQEDDLAEMPEAMAQKLRLVTSGVEGSSPMNRHHLRLWARMLTTPFPSFSLGKMLGEDSPTRADRLGDLIYLLAFRAEPEWAKAELLLTRWPVLFSQEAYECLDRLHRHAMNEGQLFFARLLSQLTRDSDNQMACNELFQLSHARIYLDSDPTRDQPGILNEFDPIYLDPEEQDTPLPLHHRAHRPDYCPPITFLVACIFLSGLSLLAFAHWRLLVLHQRILAAVSFVFGLSAFTGACVSYQQIRS